MTGMCAPLIGGWLMAFAAAMPCLSAEAPAPAGMAWIPGGEFAMGSDQGDANERPVHRVRLSGFWIDQTEVTNAQFAAFVQATGYRTTAESPVDWEALRKQLAPGTPRPPEELLRPGALVFTPPSQPLADLGDYRQWWRWQAGADWRHPSGPGSGIAGLEDHPVVQVSWNDAAAFASWAGKRLPTEAEWECAARGGLAGKRYCWGDDGLTDLDGTRANIWQGRFPDRNTCVDGFAGTAPVGRFPPNGFGLRDMAGNVWEWCADWYRADAYGIAVQAGAGIPSDPQGPDAPLDPVDPLTPKRVIRGGSFLCHVRYCESYRTSARRGDACDTGSPHVGFRCARSP
jgi:sulfatase modifying factor 1